MIAIEDGRFGAEAVRRKERRPEDLHRLKLYFFTGV